MKASRRIVVGLTLAGVLGVLGASGGCDAGPAVSDGKQVQDPPPIPAGDSGSALRQQKTGQPKS